MKNGIYGIASLTGAPIEPRDIKALALDRGRQTLHHGDCAMALEDSQLSAIHFVKTHDGMCALLGHLDEPDDVADMLGVDRKTGIARLAAAAHQKWGAEIATKLMGEWLMVRWHSSSRTLTLVMGECIRDHCYFTTNGTAVAFSPELTRLSRLSWTSDDFDPEMLLRSMGTYETREAMNGRSIVKGIDVLRAGEEVVIDAAGVSRSFATRVPPVPIRRIAFEEAVFELRAALHRILNQHLERCSNPAFLLSGGLDSSLLAAFAAEAIPPGGQMVFLTSAAPIDSQLVDETEWAGMVSRHLGVPMIPVTPASDCDVYRPGDRTFEAFETPLQSPRHYLYEALEDAALAQGSTALVDGAFGELTVSNDPAFDKPQSRLAFLRQLARGALNRLSPPEPQLSAQHFVRLSPEVRFSPLNPPGKQRTQSLGLARDGVFGILHGAVKAAGQPTHSSVPALRCLYPFRDRRLIRLMSGYPASFATYRGETRAAARHLMRGRLPKAITERTSKLGFSPAHELLLRDHADRALARLSDDQVDEAGQWLDVAWLKKALAKIATGDAITPAMASEVQATAVAIEFFRWWRNQRLVGQTNA